MSVAPDISVPCADVLYNYYKQIFEMYVPHWVTLELVIPYLKSKGNSHVPCIWNVQVRDNLNRGNCAHVRTLLQNHFEVDAPSNAFFIRLNYMQDSVWSADFKIDCC